MDFLLSLFDTLMNGHAGCTFSFLPGLLIGMGAGALKSAVSDAPRYEAKKRLAAETTRYSPWTGMVGQMPDAPDTFGSLMQGGLTGASFQQGLESAPTGGDSSYAGILGKKPSLGVNTEMPNFNDLAVRYPNIFKV
jgi:hypothetical protein